MAIDGEVPGASAAAVTKSLVGGEASAAPVSAEQLDVKAYTAQYSGRTRLPRLLFIAERCGVESVELDALRMAHDEARSREDTLLYNDAVLRINGRLGPLYEYDERWVNSVERRAHILKDKLEKKLNCNRSKVINNSNFLELVPEVKELINDFYSSRYASCLEHLNKLRPTLLVDIYLHKHLEILYKDIRHKAIIQYTIPYISIDLNTMADAFKTSVYMLEKELAALITENKIKARIDSHDKILYATSLADQGIQLSRGCSKLAQGGRAEPAGDYKQNTWSYLFSEVDEMTMCLTSAFNQLKGISQNYTEARERLDQLPLNAVVTSEGIDRTSFQKLAIKLRIGIFRDNIINNFSPMLSKAKSSIAKLLRHLPIEFYSKLQPEDSEKAGLFIKIVAEDHQQQRFIIY